jgi:mRNA interferase MazF
MKRGEVWWVNFDPSVGSEIQKQRPAESLVNINGVAPKAMTDQVMTADKLRLKTKMGELSELEMMGIEKAIQLHLSL